MENEKFISSIKLNEVKEKVNSDKKEWLNAREVAEILDMTVQSVYNWSKRGVLHPRKIGKMLYWNENDLLKLYNL